MILVRHVRGRSVLIFGCTMLLAGSVVFAQGHGPGGGGPPSGGGSMGRSQGGGFPGAQGGIGGQGGSLGQGADIRSSSRPMGTDSTSPQQTMQGGLRLGPPERWWDNKKFAKSLGLRAEQKKKMDDIFNANKGTVLLRYQSFVQEQSRMEQLSKQTMPDEASLFEEIDRVAQARAALEKANAHMLFAAS